MTPEQVYMYAKSYKLYFGGSYDFIKYRGQIKSMPPLIHDRGRRYYHKLAQKLNDSEIHMTLLSANFFKPNIFVADICTPECMDAGVQLSSRLANGLTLTKHTLYHLRKTLKHTDLDAWLYGELMDTRRAAMPDVLGMVINREIPLDVACMLLLVPQRHLDYDWSTYWEQRESPDTPFGVRSWLTRLQKVDQLFHWADPGYRRRPAAYVRAFWDSFGRSLDPIPPRLTLAD